MEIYHIVLSNAFVAFLTVPLRRVRYLLTVEDDLIEEGVLPPQGFGGTLGCIRFLYNVSGGSFRVFYRGAFLEAFGCIGKYELQRIISIPIARRVPLRMQHAFFTTTFVHTALVYFTVAPLQTALDTIAVNSVTTFIVEQPKPKEGEGKNADTTSTTAAAAVGDEASPAPASARPPTVRLRFASAWETAKYLSTHFPVFSMVSRLYLLDFGCRYVTSLANNKILNWLMSKAQKHYNGAEMTSFQRFVMYFGCPLIASLALSVVTYPFATYPVAHFLRLRYYQRCDEAAVRTTAAAAAVGDSSASNHSHASTSFTPKKDERFRWKDLFSHALHLEVRGFLWKSMYGREGPATPATASPTPARQECPVGAGGRSSTRCGICQVYRGFSLMALTTLLSSALAVALNRATDFVLYHTN